MKCSCAAHKPILRMTRIQKSYAAGRVSVLRNVTLEVAGGEMVALMGPSGSGKTTLLHLAGLLDNPDRGFVELDGQRVSLLPESLRAQARGRGIGFVFQQFNLIPQMTARENVALPARYAGVKRKIALQQADDMLDLVGLSDRRDHRPTQLSGGQQQRVAIARALINNPAILLADEPTGDLDSHTSEEIMNLLIRLNREDGIAMLIVTHDEAVAQQCTRIVRMLDGSVVDISAPDADFKSIGSIQDRSVPVSVIDDLRVPEPALDKLMAPVAASVHAEQPEWEYTNVIPLFGKETRSEAEITEIALSHNASAIAAPSLQALSGVTSLDPGHPLNQPSYTGAKDSYLRAA